MTLHKILVATDFSKPSHTAVRHAAQIASTRNLELAVVHTFDATKYRSAVGSAVTPDKLGEERNAVSLLLDGACSDLGRGLRISATLLDGLPDEEIVKAAHEQGADLIVVGSHDRTGLRRLVSGSVAESVVRASSIPVLLSRGRGGARPKRVLLATDFSSSAERALAVVLDMVAPPVHLDILHVVHVPFAFDGKPSLLVEDRTLIAIETEAARRAAELLAKVQGPGIELHFECEVGLPSDAILQRLERGYELVALGSHGRRGITKFLLGSVAETVLRQAPCSVLVVR